MLQALTDVQAHYPILEHAARFVEEQLVHLLPGSSAQIPLVLLRWTHSDIESGMYFAFQA